MSTLLAHDEIGTGPPVLALHGAYSTREEIRGFLPPMLPDRRIVCPDLPGMGASPSDGVASASESLDRVERLVDATIGEERFVAVGHSFGAHLVRGLAARRPRQVSAMVLICPWVPGRPDGEPSVVMEDDGAATALPDGLATAFADYFVVRTEATRDRFLAAVAGSLEAYDGPAVEAQMTRAELDTRAPDLPTLVLAARHDQVVGWRHVTDLLDAYPRAAAVVVADAGHALPHERPDEVAVALRAFLAPREEA